MIRDTVNDTIPFKLLNDLWYNFNFQNNWSSFSNLHIRYHIHENSFGRILRELIHGVIWVWSFFFLHIACNLEPMTNGVNNTAYKIYKIKVVKLNLSI